MLPSHLTRWALIISMAVVLGMTLIGIIPGQAYGQSPVDLELGGPGSTPWSIGNVVPGDMGAAVVELHNSGYSAGRVSIWISDITESDHGGDGATLDDYLFFNLSCTGLSTNMFLPEKIDSFPQSASDDEYLIIDRLDAGETIPVTWEWEFLETGLPQNDAQGDSLSFTINYQMEEISPPDETSPPPGNLWVGPLDEPPFYYIQLNILGRMTMARISPDGVFQSSFTATGPGDITSLKFTDGTQVTWDAADMLKTIKLKQSEESPVTPEGIQIIGPSFDIIGYTGSGQACSLYFSPPVELTLPYNESELPSENTLLYIGLYDATNDWTRLESPPGDTPTPGVISALLTQTSTLAVLAKLETPLPEDPTPSTQAPSTQAPSPPGSVLPQESLNPPAATTTRDPVPARFEMGGLVIEPAQVKAGQTVTISGILRNTGEVQSSYILDLEIDAEIEQSREVTLAGGESARVVFSLSRNEPGKHTVKMGGLSGEFSVMFPEEPGTDSSVYWGTIAAAVPVAGLLVYLLAMKFKIFV